MMAATGLRYVTLTVSNLADVIEECRAAGVSVAVPAPITEVRPGVTIGMVEDPDGN